MFTTSINLTYRVYTLKNTSQDHSGGLITHPWRAYFGWAFYRHHDGQLFSVQKLIFYPSLAHSRPAGQYSVWLHGVGTVQTDRYYTWL